MNQELAPKNTFGFSDFDKAPDPSKFQVFETTNANANVNANANANAGFPNQELYKRIRETKFPVNAPEFLIPQMHPTKIFVPNQAMLARVPGSIQGISQYPQNSENEIKFRRF